MCILQTGVARVKIQVNARFLCVKVGVAIMPKFELSVPILAGPRQRQQS